MATSKKNTKKSAKKSVITKGTQTINGVKLRMSQGAVAKKAIGDIERLFTKMSLKPKATLGSKRSQVGTSSVPTALIEEVAALADHSPKLLSIPFNADEAREALAYAAAFSPVATKAEAFAQRVRDSILAAKSDVGSAALAVYASMKGSIRRPEGAALRDSFDKMTEIMRERRKSGEARVNRRVKAALAKAGNDETVGNGDATTPTAHAAPAPATAPQPPTSKGATTVVVNTPGGGVA